MRSRREANASASASIRELVPCRELERQSDARAHGPAGEPLPRAKRHARGHRGERVRCAFVGERRDATPHFALLEPHRERRRDLVERHRRRLGREPIELVDEPVRQRHAYRRDQRGRIEPFERTGTMLGPRLAQGDDALPPGRTARGAIGKACQIEQTLEEIGSGAHPSRKHSVCEMCTKAFR